MTSLVVLALLVAVGAAIRGIWSPCGLSMLSTITPLAEAGRGYRFRSTAVWFVAGGVLGGAVTGALAALLATVVGAVGLTGGAALAVGAGVALAAAAVDAGMLGNVIPLHKRQVNQQWLSQYRSWVYGGGFGFQIGTGFATYIMSAAVPLTVALAALTGSPLAAFGICLAFGFTRGLAILVGAPIRTPADLAGVHATLDRWREPVRLSLIGLQLAVAAVAALAAWGGVAVAIVAPIAAVVAVAVRGRTRQASSVSVARTAHTARTARTDRDPALTR